MPERPTSSDHSPVAAVGCLAHSPQSSVPTAELSPGRAMSETIFFLLIISSFFLCRHLPRPVDVRRPSLRCPRIWHFAGLHPPSLPPPLCSHHNLPRSPPHTRTAPPPTGRGRNGKQLKKNEADACICRKIFSVGRRRICCAASLFTFPFHFHDQQPWQDLPRLAFGGEDDLGKSRG